MKLKSMKAKSQIKENSVNNNSNSKTSSKSKDQHKMIDDEIFKSKCCFVCIYKYK